MKHKGIHSALLIVALAAFAPSAAHAQQTREEAIALLTSGVWHFEGINWSNDRVFEKKGTVLVRASNANGVIKWKVDSKQVSIVFNNHTDILYLPVDPKGTKGMDQHGNDMVATLIPGSATGEASGAPSALAGLKPLTPAAPGATPAPAALDESPAGVTAMLLTKKWKFDGASWSEIRTFTYDGNMTIENNKNVARWQVTSKQIVMTFKDHKDILFLPLDPKGTKGVDEHGRLIIATQVTESALATTAPSPASSGSGSPPSDSVTSPFGTTNENGANNPPKPSASPPPTPLSQ